MAKTKLTPVDLTQCQCEHFGGSFMTLGPRPRTRCTNKPTWIATENKPNPIDGVIGRMSLCDACKKMLPGRMGRGYATCIRINRKSKNRKIPACVKDEDSRTRW